MSKELTQLVRDIQHAKDWTVEQVAASIGYSRVHLSREMTKQGNSELTVLLRNKHKDVLQNVPRVTLNGNQYSGNLNEAIRDIQEWQVSVDATLSILTGEIVVLLSQHYGKTVSSVLQQLRADIQSEIKTRLGAAQNAR